MPGTRTTEPRPPGLPHQFGLLPGAGLDPRTLNDPGSQGVGAVGVPSIRIGTGSPFSHLAGTRTCCSSDAPADRKYRSMKYSDCHSAARPSKIRRQAP